MKNKKQNIIYPGNRNRNKFSALLIIACLLPFTQSFAQSSLNLYKPWTYWWWMGSAANKQDIDIQLRDFSRSGLGGVHIIPIYGVRGFEDQFLTFLSPEWLDIIDYTIREAEKLDLGVDLTLGTGWPFGGPWIERDHAAKMLVTKQYSLSNVEEINLDIDEIMEENDLLELIGLFAKGKDSHLIDLFSHRKDRRIDLKVVKSDYTVFCYGTGNTGQKVKRAAPGGEGLVMDYLDSASVSAYLQHFDSVFASDLYHQRPRAFYHDSYEVYGADWTIDFAAHFQSLRGYSLIDYLPVLGDTSDTRRPALLADVRETLSDLLYTEFGEKWTKWCNDQGTVSRLQAHGSPGNILDLYALADIPETESFGCTEFKIPRFEADPDYQESNFGRPSPLMMKFASSPAHLLGKPRVSAETATWLANHFKVSLAQIKPHIDQLFISGINHVFYHGTTYSPRDEAYPGWLFYASTNFGKQAHFWDELPLLNSYITESQKILQNTRPDNDILLYFPVHDLWTNYPGNIFLAQDVHKYSSWFSETKFGETAKELWDNGFSFDYISDKQLEQLKVSSQNLLSVNGEHSYSLIMVPEMHFINKNTLMQLDALAKRGAKIIFIDHLPIAFSGLLAYLHPDPDLQKLKTRLLQSENVTISREYLTDLAHFKIRKEELKDKGLEFIRKKACDDYLYFVSNLNNRFYGDSISLAVDFQFAELFDPISLRRGYVETENRIYLELAPGNSIFIKTSKEKPAVAPWMNFMPEDTITLSNQWSIDFISGNNAKLPSEYHIDSLYSWTEWGDQNLESFCGKAKYITMLDLEQNYDEKADYRMIFDEINETANVTINGINCGTIWSLPYELHIPKGILKRQNRIEITVQNLSANRIRHIDREGQGWQKFYDINIVDIQYKPFNAAVWQAEPSGLVGKVRLVRGR